MRDLAATRIGFAPETLAVVATQTAATFRLWLTSAASDADLNLARGRLRDAPVGEDRIPLAPSVTSTGGLTVREWGPMQGGLRYRFIGNRPADEANTVVAQGMSVWEAFGRYRLRDFALIAAVNDLFGAEWNEAQFATTSRLRGEPTGVTELHFTPRGRHAPCSLGWNIAPSFRRFPGAEVPIALPGSARAAPQPGCHPTRPVRPH